MLSHMLRVAETPMNKPSNKKALTPAKGRNQTKGRLSEAATITSDCEVKR